MTPEQYREKYQHLFKLVCDEKLAPRIGSQRRFEWEMLRDAVEVIGSLELMDVGEGSGRTVIRKLEDFI